MIQIARSLSFLACLVLLLQGASPMGTMGGFVMTICSPDGTKDVVIGSDGQPVEAEHCPKCFVSLALVLQEPVSQPILVKLYGPDGFPTVSRRFSDSSFFGFSARGPPLV